MLISLLYYLGKISPTISYEDPDQSPVLDVYEAQILREKWSCGMDMPYCMRLTFSTKFSKVCLAVCLSLVIAKIFGLFSSEASHIYNSKCLS